MYRKRIFVGGAIALLVLFSVLSLDWFEPRSYVSARSYVRDAVARVGRKTPANPDLVFLAIDSESIRSADEEEVDEDYGPFDDPHSIEARALHIMRKQWPWSREAYGLVLERLVEAGAKVVLFDLTFPTPMTGDEPFRLALDKYRDHVVLGSNFVYSESSSAYSTVIDSQPTDDLIPPSVPRDDRIGFVNYWPDVDEVVRHVQYRVTQEEVKHMPPTPKAERFLSLAARAMIKAGFGQFVPDDTDTRLFRYTAGPGKGFPPRSVIEIFDERGGWKPRYKSGAFFRDKIVLVGAEGNWSHDVHPTPFGIMPGPELHLNAINAAIHGEFITELPRIAVWLVALLATAIALALWFSIRSPWLRLLLLLAINALEILATLYAFNRSVVLPCLPFLLDFNTVVLLGFVCDFTWERIEKGRVRLMLEKYVSSNVAREMLDRRNAFQQSLGGVVKPVTILFSDIRGYTSVSAKTDPQKLVAQLNEYLSAMVECVFRYGGTLDKFIGDAVMAVWGNVQSEGAAADATNAVRAALAMREELARLNADWKQRGMNELRIGIALNQGDVVVGNVGSQRRMEFTVIGDAVNVSWKLQELTKRAGSELVVSKSVAAHVVEHFELQELGKFEVTGFADPFEIFGVSRPITVAETRDMQAFEFQNRR